MKKLLLLLLLVFPLISAGVKIDAPKSSGGVYICMKSKSKVYHRKPQCRELRKHCNDSSIKRIPLKQAQQMKGKACKICYRPQKDRNH